MAFRKTYGKRKSTYSSARKRTTPMKRTSVRTTARRKPRLVGVQKIYSNGRKVTVSY